MAGLKRDGCQDNSNECKENAPTRTKKYKKRRIISQVLASVGNAMQYFSLGAAINFGAVEVAGLTSQDDVIKATENDLSWIGSLCFIMQAVGNVLGGTYTSLLGRKRSMLVGNIPYIVGWVIMWQSKDIPMLLFGNALLGLGTGLLCSPMASYTGEIVQPSLRGTLASVSELFAGFGSCGVLILGTMVSWRITAAIYFGQALVATACVSMLPESPIWLMSKGRNEDALKSLCRLRGWVKPEYVQEEYEELIAYNKHNSRCRKCEKNGLDLEEDPESCPHSKQNLFERFKGIASEYKTREARRPLILASMFFILASLTGLTSIKPTVINILKAFNVPIDARWALNNIGVLTIVGALICMFLVKRTGKRPIVIGSMLGSSICTLALAIYAHIYIPPETSSFEETVHVSEQTLTGPLVFFLIMVFCNTLGIVPISWMIISEIFPYTVRAFSCGLVGAVCDVAFFVAAKTYINLENNLHIYGALYFYAGISFFGVIYLYLFLQETEGKTFAEIEKSFANKNKIFYADDLVYRKLTNSSSNSSKSKQTPQDTKENDTALNLL